MIDTKYAPRIVAQAIVHECGLDKAHEVAIEVRAIIKSAVKK